MARLALLIILPFVGCPLAVASSSDDALVLVQSATQPKLLSGADLEALQALHRPSAKEKALQAIEASGKKVDVQAEKEHIAAMKIHLQAIKKQVLTKAKSEMEAALVAEHKRLEDEQAKSDADEALAREKGLRQKALTERRDVESAKRLAEEALISRPPTDNTYLPISSSTAFGTNRMNKTYVVDNRLLFAKTKGLGYRRNKNLDDKAPGATAIWGSTVKGVDEGDGWVRVGANLFLPTTINHTLVLSFHDHHNVAYEAPESPESKQRKEHFEMRKKQVAEGTSKVKTAIKDFIFEYGKGVGHELQKAKTDIGNTLENARREEQLRNKRAAQQLAMAQRAHKQEVAFRHELEEGDRAIQAAEEERNRQLRAKERTAKEEDRKFRASIDKQEHLFNEQVKAQHWASAHFSKAKPGRDCEEGWAPVMDQTSCKLALTTLGNDAAYVDLHRAWDNHPGGCYLSINTKHGNFNLGDGSLNRYDERICQRVSGASLRNRIHQELAVKKAETHLAVVDEKAQRAAEEAQEMLRLGRYPEAAPTWSTAGGAPQALSLQRQGAELSTDARPAESEEYAVAAPEFDLSDMVTRGIKEAHTRASAEAARLLAAGASFEEDHSNSKMGYLHEVEDESS